MYSLKMSTENQPQVSRINWFVIGSLTTILILCAIGFVLINVWFMLTNIANERKKHQVAEEMTQKFISLIRSGQIDAAYALFSEEGRNMTSKQDLIAIADQPPIKHYISFEICQVNQYEEAGSDVLAAMGILHYRDGNIVFANDLISHAPGTWRIYGFHLLDSMVGEQYQFCW